LRAYQGIREAAIHRCGHPLSLFNQYLTRRTSAHSQWLRGASLLHSYARAISQGIGRLSGTFARPYGRSVLTCCRLAAVNFVVVDTTVCVSYLELAEAPAPIQTHVGEERIVKETLPISEYLDLYARVGQPLRWDQRLKMPRSELSLLLESERSQLYVLRDSRSEALGFCEFERCLPDIELKNFGLVPEAQGKRLGQWLLRTALHHEWKLRPRRIWLHTDTWDHPAALGLYKKAGFQIYMTRTEPPEDL
jgi:ribosomal protein S18 acetylase RimI-like enzyme